MLTWGCLGVAGRAEGALNLDESVGRVQDVPVYTLERQVNGGARPLNIIRRVVSRNHDHPDLKLRHSPALTIPDKRQSQHKQTRGKFFIVPSSNSFHLFRR